MPPPDRNQPTLFSSLFVPTPKPAETTDGALTPDASAPSSSSASSPRPPRPSLPAFAGPDSVDTSILDVLDGDQRKAAYHDKGPLLLVAGAGAGKTRTIVARIVRLVASGVPPKSIVGITFTNRAAEEMRERVASAIPGRPSDLPWLGTFHAYGAILLRRYGTRIGLPASFSIYDQRDQLELLKTALADLNIDATQMPADRFAGVIELSKRDGMTVEEAALAKGWLFAGKANEVAQLYEKGLRDAGAVDFADLIRLPVKLLRESPETLAQVRSEVRHLLVDEFQDVDGGQAELTRLIAKDADSFCAVGDEDQSIYGWRGGSAGSMLSFEREHAGATVIHLRTNYRTKGAVLQAAAAVISKNRSRRPKELVAGRPGGEKPVIRYYYDSEEEAREVARWIDDAVSRGVPAHEVAVFFRMNSQSRPFEDALRTRNLKYVLRGGLSFYDRAVVRDALAYVRWAINTDDLVALKRVLRAPRRGVGEGIIAKAREAAKAAGGPVSVELRKINGLGPLFKARDAWKDLLPDLHPGEALTNLFDSTGFADHYKNQIGETADEDRRNLDELLRLAATEEGPGEESLLLFLERASLTGRDTSGDGRDAVRLMTLHTAKGLEFSHVVVISAEEGFLPHFRAQDSPEEVEEERRLFYVGLTRAKERALITVARRRFQNGAWRNTLPSRFLAEIPPDLVTIERRDGGAADDNEGAGRFGGSRKWSGGGTGSRRDAGNSAWTPPTRGMDTPSFRRDASGGASGSMSGSSSLRQKRVRHPIFGEGFVEMSEGEGTERKIVARFPSYGLKKILVRAVKMEFFD